MQQQLEREKQHDQLGRKETERRDVRAHFRKEREDHGQTHHQIIQRRRLKPTLTVESHAEQDHHSHRAKQDVVGHRDRWNCPHPGVVAHIQQEGGPHIEPPAHEVRSQPWQEREAE